MPGEITQLSSPVLPEAIVLRNLLQTGRTGVRKREATGYGSAHVCSRQLSYRGEVCSLPNLKTTASMNGTACKKQYLELHLAACNSYLLLSKDRDFLLSLLVTS